MKLLYVMSEYPSVSETFIVNEAAAVNELGVPVVGYALRRGLAVRSAADVELICPPATRLQLAMAAIRNLPGLLAGVWQARHALLAPREMARLLFAFAHASYAARSSARVTHVHAHFLGRSADVASALAPRLGCKWTATAHASDVYAPVEPGLLRWRLRSIAAVACANRGVQRGVDRHAAPATVRTEIVHCGVDTRVLTSSAAWAPGDLPHIVTVGRLVATKGHWTILESAVSLMRRDDALRWTIAGDGPLYEQLTQDPRYLELSPRMTFTGAMDHAVVLDLVGKATVFVLPCEQGADGESDGIPVAVMEAMALGVPVVTTPIGGIPELVIPGENGFLVAPKDARGLTETLEKILYEALPSDIERIRDAARRKIELEFDLLCEAGVLIKLLEPYM
jgi:glycosyltransferase involved in cell wall biosynthesis